MFNRVIKYIKNVIKKNHNTREGGINIILGLTYACQCDCVHCGMAIYDKNISAELNTADWLKIINGFPTKIVKSIIFFGGEPTLRNDLLKLISTAKQKGFQTTIDTNGYLLTDDFVKKLKNIGLDLCEVSIDSLNPGIHDGLRKLEGIFEIAQLGIKNCKVNNLDFCISTYATKNNIKNGELKKIIDWARKLGAIYVRVLSPILIGRWLNKNSFKLNSLEKKALNNILDGRFAFSEEKDCISINRQMIYISPYGEVQPCPYIPFTFGNINRESIENIIDKMFKHSMYKIKTSECLMNNEKFRKNYIKNLKTIQKFPIDLS